MVRQILALLLTISVVLSPAACGNSVLPNRDERQDTSTTNDNNTNAGNNRSPAGRDLAGIPEYSLSAACVFGGSGTVGKLSYQMADRIFKESDGKIAITIYPDSQLGSESELVEAVQAGNISMMISGPSSHVSVVPETAVLNICGLFTDVETCNAVLAGEFYHIIDKYYESANLKLLALVATGFREMTSNKPVYKYEDFENIKIRALENTYHAAYWSALGAVPVPMPFSELHIGLKEGVVEAQDNPIPLFRSAGLFEVQKYIIMTNHIPTIATPIMNLSLFESMKEEYQEIIIRNMDLMQQEVIDANNAMEQEILEDLVDRGMTVIYPDGETLQKMQAGTDAAIEEMNKNIDPVLVDRFISAVRS